MHPYALLATTGTLLAGWVVVLLIERSRGRRFAEPVRMHLDHIAVAIRGFFAAHMPVVNRYHMRQLFHYAIHQALSVVLFAIGTVERGVRRIVRFNRRRAEIAREPRSDSHLSHMLAHKEASALSEEEKTARKDAALRGENQE
jgi:hypothetical protein